MRGVCPSCRGTQNPLVAIGKVRSQNILRALACDLIRFRARFLQTCHRSCAHALFVGHKVAINPFQLEEDLAEVISNESGDHFHGGGLAGGSSPGDR